MVKEFKPINFTIFSIHFKFFVNIEIVGNVGYIEGNLLKIEDS